jgi:hypothetical protein
LIYCVDRPGIFVREEREAPDKRRRCRVPGEAYDALERALRRHNIELPVEIRIDLNVAGRIDRRTERPIDVCDRGLSCGRRFRPAASNAAIPPSFQTAKHFVPDPFCHLLLIAPSERQVRHALTSRRRQPARQHRPYRRRTTHDPTRAKVLVGTLAIKCRVGVRKRQADAIQIWTIRRALARPGGSSSTTRGMASD